LVLISSTSNGYIFANFEKEQSFDIPKFNHFIWYGSKIPEKYLINIRTYLKNMDYQIFLWIDTEIEEIRRRLDNTNIKVKDISSLTMINDVAMKYESIIAKADIMRLEIVYQYGGIYTDIDSIWHLFLLYFFQSSKVSIHISKKFCFTCF